MLTQKILEERNSKINGRIVVAKSLGLGTYIQVNGLTQSGGIVESIWKQTLKKVHRSLITNHRTLILGLGGGTAAKIAKSLWPKAKITGVEIDPVMVDLGIRYLDLELSQTEIIIADAFKFITVHQSPFTDHFDLVIVDTYVGDRVPPRLQSENYIRLVRSHLSRSGVAVFNRLYYGEKRPEAVKFGEKLKKIFSNVEYFYPEANLMFLCYN